jgi:hypothetical protein
MLYMKAKKPLCVTWTNFPTHGNYQTTFKWVLIVLHYSRRFVSTRACGSFPSGASQEKKRQLALTFISRYIDDILSLNNTRFGEYLHLIYLIDFEVKATTPRQM